MMTERQQQYIDEHADRLSMWAKMIFSQYASNSEAAEKDYYEKCRRLLQTAFINIPDDIK